MPANKAKTDPTTDTNKYIKAKEVAPLWYSKIKSKENFEKVVKPPSRPVVKNICQD